MRIAGHPIHSMILHFPAALLPMDALLTAFAYWRNNPDIYHAAFYCMTGGVLLGYLALLTGLIDLIPLYKKNTAAFGTGLIHGFINATVILIYSLFAYRAFHQFPALVTPQMVLVFIKIVLMLTLITGNYYGGKLVYNYLVGTKPVNHD